MEIRLEAALLAMELAEALEAGVDLMHSIISVVRLHHLVKEMLVAMVNMFLLLMVLVAEAAVLVRQVEPMYLVMLQRMVVLDLHHQLREQLLIMLAVAGQAMVLVLLAQAVLVVVEMEILIMVVITLMAVLIPEVAAAALVVTTPPVAALAATAALAS